MTTYAPSAQKLFRVSKIDSHVVWDNLIIEKQFSVSKLHKIPVLHKLYSLWEFFSAPVV